MISEKKLQANRCNSVAGGLAYKAKRQELYEANPSFCKQCNEKLPQSKKNNSFCSKSCAATFNNTGREKVPRYKCLHCDNQIKKGKYCSTTCMGEGQRKYQTPEQALVARRNRVREVSANYRAKLRNQTPIDADRKAIQEFYAQCPKGFEVDHIIPISKGGLHALNNLQYLPMRENRSKGSKIL